MGDLIRSWCAPICQERCENSMIIRDEYCFSTMCRFGCMCPPDRPLRNGLKCISRADCLPKPGKIEILQNTIYNYKIFHFHVFKVQQIIDISSCNKAYNSSKHYSLAVNWYKHEVSRIFYL